MTEPLLERDSNGAVTVCGVEKVHTKLFQTGVGTTKQKTTEENNKEHNKKKRPNVTDQKPIELFKLWEEVSGVPLSPQSMRVISDMELEYGDRVVEYAMREAKKYKKTDTLAYVRRVCNNGRGKFDDGTAIGELVTLRGV